MKLRRKMRKETKMNWKAILTVIYLNICWWNTILFPVSLWISGALFVGITLAYVILSFLLDK